MEPWSALVYYLVFHFVQALLVFRDPTSYLYWPYLVSTGLIAWGAERWLRRRGTPSASLFSRALWWHPSARLDYLIYLVNALTLPALFGALALAPQSVSRFFDHLLGNAGNGTVSAGVAITAAYTLAFFIAFDFARFYAHWLLHRVPALWEIHKVHHSAAVMTLFTSYRGHPLEFAWMSAWVLLLGGAVTWAFNRALGGPINFHTFLGIHVLLACGSFVDNLRHSPVWLSYGPRAGQWLISPAHHQLHHSQEQRHWGCNLGSSLAVWDRLFGTLYVPGMEPESFELGLGPDAPDRHTGPVSIYLTPLAKAARALIGR